jgi:hypothetical protein
MKDVSISNSSNQSSANSRSKREESSFPMTPGQYFDQRMRGRHLDGETRLMFAVLEDAIRCYLPGARTCRGSHQRAQDEVREWVNIKGEHDLFSFEAICRVFEIEPEKLRHQLNSMKAAKVRLHRFRMVGRRTVIMASDRSRRARSRGF